MKDRIKGLLTKKKLFRFFKIALIVIFTSIVFLSLFGTVAHATGLVDDTVNDATAFLETFFKLYPTATDKELAYYVEGNVLEPINGDYLYSELVNPVFTKDGDNVKVSVAVKFIDDQTKAIQVSQFDLTLAKMDGNWKIIK